MGGHQHTRTHSSVTACQMHPWYVGMLPGTRQRGGGGWAVASEGVHQPWPRRVLGRRTVTLFAAWPPAQHPGRA